MKTKKELYAKLMETFMGMIQKGELDEDIFGDQFWEINERKIELLDPTEVKINTETSDIIRTRSITRPSGGKDVR